MCTRLNEAAFGVALAAALVCWSSVGLHGAEPTSEQGYSTCKTWQEVVEGQNLRYADVRRGQDGRSLASTHRPAKLVRLYLEISRRCRHRRHSSALGGWSSPGAKRRLRSVPGLR